MSQKPAPGSDFGMDIFADPSAQQKGDPKPKRAREELKEGDGALNGVPTMDVDDDEGGDDGDHISREEFEAMRQKYLRAQRQLALQGKENDELIRDNEVLNKELNEVRGQVRSDDPHSPSQSDDEVIHMQDRPVRPNGAEALEAYKNLERSASVADVGVALGLSGGRVSSHEPKKRIHSSVKVSTSSVFSLSSLREQRGRMARAKKEAEAATSDFNSSLVMVAQRAQLHVKLGKPGVPLNEKQAIAASNDGLAPGLAHLAILMMASERLTEGLRLAETAEDDHSLARNVLACHMADAANYLALLHRGLKEDVLFAQDVSHVAEYQYLLCEGDESGRSVIDLLKDADVERNLQLVRSTATNTKQIIAFPDVDTSQSVMGMPPPPPPPPSLPSQNQIMFGSFQNPPAIATVPRVHPHSSNPPSAPQQQQQSMGYQPDRTGNMLDTVKHCDYFQKRKGCYKGSRCRFVTGHCCAVCGSRNHGAWKHGQKSRYQPYKKRKLKCE